MKMLSVKDLHVQYGDYVVLDSVSFDLDEGQWLMIVGPNGAGKSTIVNAVSGGAPCTGEVLCLGRNIRSFKPHELARHIGVLAQKNAVGYSFTVREVIRLGRYAYSKGVFGGGDPGCEAAIDEALRLTGLTELENKSVLQLSGGELQRVFLAQLFSQDPKIMILDEPMNHLDLVCQKQLLGLVSDWLKTPGRAVISVMHDLSLAKAFGTQVLLLQHGRVVADGPAGEVLTREHLSQVYGMDVHEWMNELLSQWS